MAVAVKSGEEPSVNGDSWLLVERGHAGIEGRPICVTIFGAMLTVLTALTVDLPVLCRGVSEPGLVGQWVQRVDGDGLIAGVVPDVAIGGLQGPAR